MAGSAACCAHCGKGAKKKGAALKRCATCKQVWYCGTECQNSAWKGHKRTCEPPLPLDDVKLNLKEAHAIGDWRGVLKLEGRVEELLEGRGDAVCNYFLEVFTRAHVMGRNATRSRTHALSVIRLEKRRIELLGKMQRFRDQASALCCVADSLCILDNFHEASRTYTRARDLGAEHGFFSAECLACLGLGHVCTEEGRPDEALELLRNAVAASNLVESDDSCYLLNSLQRLIDALLLINAIDEMEPLILRFREAVDAEWRNDSRFRHQQ